MPPIYGARQTGKSTMIRYLLDEKFKYIALDDLSVRDYAIKDPKGFLWISISYWWKKEWMD